MALSKDFVAPTPTVFSKERANIDDDFFGGASTSTPFPNTLLKGKKNSKLFEHFDIQESKQERQKGEVDESDNSSDHPDFVRKYFEEVAARERLREKYEKDREKWNSFKTWLVENDREKNGGGGKDGIEAFKAEIRSVKGVLLAARNFPAGGRVGVR